MKKQINEEVLKTLTFEAVSRAGSHVERVSPGWLDVANYYLMRYPAHFFTSEDIRELAYDLGFPHPPDERAWGAVFLKAQKNGTIRFYRFTRSRMPQRHMGWAAEWLRVTSQNFDQIKFEVGEELYCYIPFIDLDKSVSYLNDILAVLHRKRVRIIEVKLVGDMPFYEVYPIDHPEGSNIVKGFLVKARYLFRYDPKAINRKSETQLTLF